MIASPYAVVETNEAGFTRLLNNPQSSCSKNDLLPPRERRFFVSGPDNSSSDEGRS